MTGAIEFLRKAKAICKNHPDCIGCPINGTCLLNEITDESDLVRKVMDYQLSEDEIDGKAEYEETMKRDFHICEVCEDNQLINCAYLENDDRKSCPKVMDYQKEAPNEST